MITLRRLLSGILVSLLVAGGAQAGEFNRVLSIGDAAPAWEGLPGVDGGRHGLADLADQEAVVVVFTCNSCPYAVDVQSRLVRLAKKYQRHNVAVVAINVNRIEEDRLPAMKARAEEAGFVFPYLFDESQQIARQYGATYTPEFFVLDRDRKVVYMGALDDSPEGSEVTERYVEEAISAALEDRPPATTETVAIGCRVRYERQRRRRR